MVPKILLLQWVSKRSSSSIPHLLKTDMRFGWYLLPPHFPVTNVSTAQKKEKKKKKHKKELLPARTGERAQVDHMQDMKLRGQGAVSSF